MYIDTDRPRLCDLYKYCPHCLGGSTDERLQCHAYVLFIGWEKTLQFWYSCVHVNDADVYRLISCTIYFINVLILNKDVPLKKAREITRESNKFKKPREKYCSQMFYSCLVFAVLYCLF